MRPLTKWGSCIGVALKFCPPWKRLLWLGPQNGLGLKRNFELFLRVFLGSHLETYLPLVEEEEEEKPKRLVETRLEESVRAFPAFNIGPHYLLFGPIHNYLDSI